MIVYLLEKFVGSYDDAMDITCGVFSSVDLAIDCISKKEKMPVSEIKFDADSTERAIYTEAMFRDPVDDDMESMYQITKLTLDEDWK